MCVHLREGSDRSTNRSLARVCVLLYISPPRNWTPRDRYDPGPSQNRMDMVEPWNVDGLTIRDVTLTRSPAWTVHPVMCSNVLVQNITLLAGVNYDDIE